MTLENLLVPLLAGLLQPAKSKARKRQASQDAKLIFQKHLHGGGGGQKNKGKKELFLAETMHFCTGSEVEREKEKTL